MRNTQEGAWATLVREARGAVSRAAFARAVDVDRSTILRWEEGRTVPTDPDIVARFADKAGIPREAAARAAGFISDGSISTSDDDDTPPFKHPADLELWQEMRDLPREERWSNIIRFRVERLLAEKRAGGQLGTG